MTESRAPYGPPPLPADSAGLRCPHCGSDEMWHSEYACIRALVRQRDAWQAAYDVLWRGLVQRVERGLKQKESVK